MIFSQRRGLKPAQKLLQLDSMDHPLRNGLWSCIFERVFKLYESPRGQLGQWLGTVADSNLEPLFRNYWVNFFKQPVDTIPNLFDGALATLRQHFFSCQWNEVYDFVEFTLKSCPAHIAEVLRKDCNARLRAENSGYRVAATGVVPITDETELDEIAQSLTSPLPGVKTHLAAAAGLLSDRKVPDYRNSIKESISAVEAVCRVVAGDEKATLGDGLRAVQSKVELHGALRAAFEKLYGYSSDEGGIRHAMLDEPNIGFAEAKFMLVTCSAFVNFLLTKAAEAGLAIGS